MTDAELGKTIRELLRVSEGIVFLTAHNGIACLGVLDRLDEATAVVLYEFAAEASFHEAARAGNGIRTHDIMLGKHSSDKS